MIWIQKPVSNSLSTLQWPGEHFPAVVPATRSKQVNNVHIKHISVSNILWNPYYEELRLFQEQIEALPIMSMVFLPKCLVNVSLQTSWRIVFLYLIYLVNSLFINLYISLYLSFFFRLLKTYNAIYIVTYICLVHSELDLETAMFPKTCLLLNMAATCAYLSYLL